MKRLSFWDGARAFFGGCGFVIATPRVWPYAMVPVLVALALVSGLSALGVWGGLALAERLVDADTAFGAARVTLEIFFGVTAVLFALLVGFTLAQPLSGFALEAIVRRQERALGARGAWPEASLRVNLARSLGVTFTSLAIGVPILLVLTVVELFAPPAAVVTIPLKFLVSALMVAWDFLDYPLGLRARAAGERVEFVRANLGAVIAFGSLSACVLLVPGLGLLLLPMGVAGAARLVLRSEET